MIMKRIVILITFLNVLPAILMGQAETKESKFGIRFTGFVKTDYFFDSRENYTIREGHFLLYPKEPLIDADGNDIHDNSSFNFLSIQSRLSGHLSGPDAFGAKTSGLLEADFFGNENAVFLDNNGFRLRHAYVKLNWEKTELLAGQTWHPFFITECFSGVISFNTGVPFQPFSRSPQIRLTQKLGNFSVAATLSSERDFTSPQGPFSLRQSSIPVSTVTVSYKHQNTESNQLWLAGFGADFKVLQPLLNTTNNGLLYKTTEKVSGLSFTAFAKHQNNQFTAKLQTVYGQNLFDLIMLGGYAVHDILDNTRNTVSYTTLNQVSAWAEIHTNGKKLQFGLWGGYTQNLGSNKSILVYSNQVDGTASTIRGANIKSVYRISPRVVIIQNKLKFATEFELTSVAYATKDDNGNLQRDDFGVITDAEWVSNLRILFAVIYSF